ncbi:mitochondrial large subunit ribosomal protein-domain-containing protein [Apodospora peruviana]|uniref:Large ribosomal subunit protein mL49 n=1 Tax=Apodospora peruviana TaxID=516989 RepID=A0AAE0LYT5_9PEZI|nr:mitochondrial large subunit ribosomal protein-domain-containing protein [Apodospora peruviana]
MLRPNTICRASPSQLRCLLTAQIPAITTTPSLLQNQTVSIRAKSTINKHARPKHGERALQAMAAAAATQTPEGDASSKRTRSAKSSKTTTKPTEQTIPVQPAAEAPSRPPPPFLVNRTPSNNLPIYLVKKRGGNKKLTLIRKLEGDRSTLAKWLAEDFNLDKGKVYVKAPAMHVEVEGDYVAQVKGWLEARGF